MISLSYEATVEGDDHLGELTPIGAADGVEVNLHGHLWLLHRPRIDLPHTTDSNRVAHYDQRLERFMTSKPGLSGTSFSDYVYPTRLALSDPEGGFVELRPSQDVDRPLGRSRRLWLEGRAGQLVIADERGRELTRLSEGEGFVDPQGGPLKWVLLGLPSFFRPEPLRPGPRSRLSPLATRTQAPLAVSLA